MTTWEELVLLGWAEHLAAGEILLRMRGPEPGEHIFECSWNWNRLGETKLGLICRETLKRHVDPELIAQLERPDEVKTQGRHAVQARGPRRAGRKARVKRP